MKKKGSTLKNELIAKKSYALNSNLWKGDNVIVANAIQLGVQNLQINSKRIVYLGLSKIEKHRAGEAEFVAHDDKSRWSVTLTAKDFAETFNMHENNVYDFMRLGVDQLLKKDVHFSYIDQNTDQVKEVKVPWVVYAEYLAKTGTVQIVFNDYLTSYITRIASSFGGYTIQKIKQSGGIRTLRGWRLFDLLTTQRDTGVFTITKAKLYETLEVKGEIEYFEFKRSILDPAIKDIRENAKVDTVYEEKKTGRRITSLIFKFKDDANASGIEKIPETTVNQESPFADTEEYESANDLADRRIRENIAARRVQAKFNPPPAVPLEKIKIAASDWDDDPFGPDPEDEQLMSSS
jgi:plasmid replication initiation protein